jgi:hypothetical protein
MNLVKAIISRCWKLQSLKVVDFGPVTVFNAIVVYGSIS